MVLEENDTDHNDSVIKIVNFIQIKDIKNDQRNLRMNEKCETYNGIIYIKLNNKKKIWLSENLNINLIHKVHNTLGHVGTKQMELMIAH